MNNINSENLVEALRAGNVNCLFEKKDGTERYMTCTLNFENIPKAFHPKPKKVAEGIEPEPVPPITESSNVHVFDLVAKGWRSLPLSRLKWAEVRYELVRETPEGEDV